MKARVKATGEIIDIQHDYDLRESTVVEFYTNIENPKKVFEKEELEFLNDSEFIDYWTRLEHQYAGMAMQGILADSDLLMSLINKKADDYPVKYIVAEFAKDCAHALVEKYKKEEQL